MECRHLRRFAFGFHNPNHAAAITAFGEDLSDHSPTPTHSSNFFTGKPYVEGLGHTFLFRNYRANLGKWQIADPLGYPDGWNQLAYCGNEVISSVDFLGCKLVYKNIFYFKKIDFDIPVVIPGGLPISVNPTPPTIGSALVSWIMDQFAQGIAKDVKPNWVSIKHFANESGFGNLEPSREEILNEIINNGYEDWEYVSDSFFWENHQSDIMGEGEFVYNVTLCWKIEIRKWEE